MNTTTGLDQHAAAWLADGPTELSDRVLDAALREVHLTKQRRVMRVPWRFPLMPAMSRATAVAAVALVAVVGAGGLLYLNSTAPGHPGGSSTPAATIAPTPQPSQGTPGIAGWKTFKSAVYDYTISYPDDWSVAARATEKWQPGASEDDPYWDIFLNPQAVDGDSMVFQALQFPGPAGADLASWDGLLNALTEMCANPAEFYEETPCPSEGVTPMCLGSSGCRPVAFVHDDGLPQAVFGDPETGTVTYILVGRLDNFPAAARYGGSVMLMTSILHQMGIREPQPGETPD